MLQKKNLLILIFVLILGYGIQHLKDYRRDSKIKEETKAQGAIQKQCAFPLIEDQVACLMPKLEKISKDNISLNYKFIEKDKDLKILAIDHGSYLEITRPADLKMGGSCLASFFLFKFDAKSIYISKDNPFGIIVCRDKLEPLIIAPESMTLDQIKNEIHTISNIKF